MPLSPSVIEQQQYKPSVVARWQGDIAAQQAPEMQGVGCLPQPERKVLPPWDGEALTSGGLSGKYGSLLKIFSLSHIQATSWAEPRAPQESNE